MINEYNEEMKQLFSQISDARSKLIELKKKLGKGEVQNYSFDSADGKISLFELFGRDKMDLMVIQNMGTGCKYCTLWADNLNGLVPHLEDRAGLALVSNDPIDSSLKFAAERGWNFRMVSSAGTSFKEDLGFHSDEYGTSPGVSTFKKNNDGTISNVANEYFGPGDDYCAQWHLMELLDEGADGWVPEYSY